MPSGIAREVIHRRRASAAEAHAMTRSVGPGGTLGVLGCGTVSGTGTLLGTVGLGVGTTGNGRWLLLVGISSFVRGKVK